MEKQRLNIKDRWKNIKKIARLIVPATIFLLSACASDLGEVKIAQTAQALQDKGLATSFVETAEFSKELYDSAIPGIVKLTFENKDATEVYGCSGGIYPEDDPSGYYVLLAKHCIEEPEKSNFELYRIYITSNYFDSENGTRGFEIKKSDNLDYALIKIFGMKTNRNGVSTWDTEPIFAKSPIKIQKENPSVGSPILIIGFPRGSGIPLDPSSDIESRNNLIFARQLILTNNRYSDFPDFPVLFGQDQPISFGDSGALALVRSQDQSELVAFGVASRARNSLRNKVGVNTTVLISPLNEIDSLYASFNQ